MLKNYRFNLVISSEVFLYLYFMKYLLILLLFSCSTLPIHQANLIQQQKLMLQFDQKSRNEQQKIRDSRKKRVKVYKKRTINKYI